MNIKKILFFEVDTDVLKGIQDGFKSEQDYRLDVCTNAFQFGQKINDFIADYYAILFAYEAMLSLNNIEDAIQNWKKRNPFVKIFILADKENNTLINMINKKIIDNALSKQTEVKDIIKIIEAPIKYSQTSINPIKTTNNFNNKQVYGGTANMAQNNGFPQNQFPDTGNQRQNPYGQPNPAQQNGFPQQGQMNQGFPQQIQQVQNPFQQQMQMQNQGFPQQNPQMQGQQFNPYSQGGQQHPQNIPQGYPQQQPPMGSTPQQRPQGMNPQGMPQGMPPQNMPQGYPQQSPAQQRPQGMPQGYPQQQPLMGSMPQQRPQGMNPQGMPQAMPPQNMPPQNMPQGYPQQPSMGNMPQQVGMQGGMMPMAQGMNMPRSHDKIPRRTVITVHSPKGGVGKSTISKELAVTYALNAPAFNMKVCLVDMNIDYGNIAVMLDMKPVKTMATWARNITGKLNALPEFSQKELNNITYSFEEIENHYLLKHSSGLYVLAAPTNHRDAGMIADNETKVMINNLKNHFDILIIDTGPDIKDVTFEALLQADRLLLVCNMEIPTLNDLDQLQKTLHALNYPQDKISIIMNETDKNLEVQAQEAVSYLKFQHLIGIVPRSQSVAHANDQGASLVMGADSQFTIAIKQIANEIIPIVKLNAGMRNKQPKKKGFFSKK